MKNSSDTIGNRTHDLPACSAVPQQTAPPRDPINSLIHDIYIFTYFGYMFRLLQRSYLQAAQDHKEETVYVRTMDEITSLQKVYMCVLCTYFS